MSLAVKAGYLHGTADLSLPSLAVEAGVRVSTGGPSLWILVETGWEYASKDSAVDVDGFVGRRLSASSDVVPLMGSLGWRPRLSDRVLVSVTGGAGVVLVATRVSLSGEPEATDTWVAPAAQGTAALGYRWGPGHTFIEGRYRFAPGADRDSQIESLSAAGVHVGYAVEFF